MERLVAVWLADLEVERVDGSSLREFSSFLDALGELCPFVDPLRRGLCLFPMRAPRRFYGTEEAVLERLYEIVERCGLPSPRVGVAQGVFSAEAAARRDRVVTPGEEDLFRYSLPIEELAPKDVAATLRRLGISSVGRFAELSERRVAERFSALVVELHRVARGEQSEAPGQRDASVLRALGRETRDTRGVDEQLGFFGHRGAREQRALAAAWRVRSRLGEAGVLVASLRAGRAPEDRDVLVPFDAPEPRRSPEAPWPGRLGSPTPVRTPRQPLPVSLTDSTATPVTVGVRGFLSGDPVRLDLGRGSWREVTWYAGPWPSVEEWWGVPRRRAHLQVVTDRAEAYLLRAEGERWWIAGVYD